MDLGTSYMGLRLANPLIVGACPLADDLDVARRLEDAGASAIVFRSLFEEAITHPEAAPDQQAETYLERIERTRQALEVPVIGSLNGHTRGGWLRFARWMQEAGADGIELNVYHIETDVGRSGEDVERGVLELLKDLKGQLTIPVAVKLSPFYTSLPHFAARLSEAGADGLVLFNRFYEPDVDPEDLTVERKLRLSTSGVLPMRLRWTAILSERVSASLAVTGGVHSGVDTIKAVMAGAHATQIVSALLIHGAPRLSQIRAEIEEWLDRGGYSSLEQARGRMNLIRCGAPRGYERTNYMDILDAWEQSRPEESEG